MTDKISKPVYQMTKGGEILVRFGGVKEAGRVTGFSYEQIRQVCLGRRKEVGGYRWAYVSEKDEIIVDAWR